MSSFGRRSFLAGLGSVGASAAPCRGSRRLATRRPSAGRRARSSGERPAAATSTGACSGRSSSTSAAPSTRASTSRGPAGRRQGLPYRRRARGQGTRRARSSATPAATSFPATTGSTASGRRRNGRRARARLELDRDEPVRHQRVHRLVPLVGTEPLLGMNFGTGTVEMAVAYVEYCNVDRGTQLERSAALARLRAAAQRALLVPRQRDGRPVADRPAAGARVRPQGA